MIKKKDVTKYQRDRLFVLNDQWSPRISPALAEEIGLNESILFLQIEFLIAISDHFIQGEKWTYQSITDLKEMLPFWSKATINRAIQSLEARGLIHSNNFNQKKYDRTRWFAINLEEARKLKSIRFEQTESESSQNETDSEQSGTRRTPKETTIPNSSTNTSPDKNIRKSKEPLSAAPQASFDSSNQISYSVSELEIHESPPSVKSALGNIPPGKLVLRDSEPVVQVFNDWCQVMECPDAVLNKKYRTAIASRLKEGYSVDDLKLATRGILFSPYHTGKNDLHALYFDLELICRDGTKVQKFKNIAKEKGVQANDPIKRSDYHRKLSKLVTREENARRYGTQYI